MTIWDIAPEYRGWGEPDDDPPERLRCTRGHYLPQTPTGMWIDAGEEGRGPITPEQIKALPTHMHAWIEPYWMCKCGAEAQEDQL